jgi:hypothetical protein
MQQQKQVQNPKKGKIKNKYVMAEGTSDFLIGCK